MPLCLLCTTGCAAFCSQTQPASLCIHLQFAELDGRRVVRLSQGCNLCGTTVFPLVELTLFFVSVSSFCATSAVQALLHRFSAAGLYQLRRRDTCCQQGALECPSHLTLNYCYHPVSCCVMASVFCGFKNRCLVKAVGSITFPLRASQRSIATVPFHMQTPTPPPREYNPDGSPKVYRLNQVTYDHKYDWERWHFQPVGVFHTVYRGYFARDQKPLQAAMLQYHTAVIAVPTLLFVFGLSFILMSASLYGIRPKRYTIEWMLASKERDRAENSNPCTRYLDRRRKERGPNWIVEDYLPWHPFFMNMKKYHSDTEYAQYKAKKEGKASDTEASE